MWTKCYSDPDGKRIAWYLSWDNPIILLYKERAGEFTLSIGDSFNNLSQFHTITKRTAREAKKEAERLSEEAGYAKQ